MKGNEPLELPFQFGSPLSKGEQSAVSGITKLVECFKSTCELLSLNLNPKVYYCQISLHFIVGLIQQVTEIRTNFTEIATNRKKNIQRWKPCAFGEGDKDGQYRVVEIPFGGSDGEITRGEEISNCLVFVYGGMVKA